MLSDPRGEVIARYGILDAENKVARRTTFVVDRTGVIRHIEQGKAAMDPAGAVGVCKRM